MPAAPQEDASSTAKTSAAAFIIDVIIVATMVGTHRGPYELVIFDCDGVLVDTERLIVEVDAFVLTDMGWPMSSAEVVERFVGRSHEYATAQLSERLGIELEPDWDEAYREHYMNALDDLEAVPGVVDALDHIHLPMCVASSGRHEVIRSSLTRVGLYDRFEGRIFSATEVQNGKPAPDLFLHAAEQIGTAPSRCVVVEDSQPGVEAGIAAGMSVLGYGSGVTPAERLSQAGGTIFYDMKDLPQLVSGRA